MAAILLGETRKTDKCIRWGGEEFIVLLPFCDLGKARDIAENIRSVMASRKFPDIGQVTLSIGVTESVPGDRPMAMLDRVDKLLYQAKGNGKNRVAAGLPGDGPG
ncbi:GGDEF domain-containing protein [Marinobacter bryozoorum]|nr:GGDEF domain-containing protein [Marinobacter bryozoorum]